MHSHTASHHRHEKDQGKKLLWATFLNFSITLVQIVGGVLSNSLSLISDALHNLGDSSAIFIAFLAGKHAQREPDTKKTFGYKRTEILAALFNAIVLIAICLYLFVEAYRRFVHPEPIRGKVMLLVASFGLLANLISVVILHHDKSHNLNIRAAYLHLLGDTLSSVAVMLGGIAIWAWDIYWIDPLVTVLVGLYIIRHTWGIIRETVAILMQATPKGLDLAALQQEAETFPEVENLHHLHVWKLDDEHIHLEAHVNIRENLPMAEVQRVREAIEDMLTTRYGIAHVTLQVEYRGCPEHNELIHKPVASFSECRKPCL